MAMVVGGPCDQERLHDRAAVVAILPPGHLVVMHRDDEAARHRLIMVRPSHADVPGLVKSPGALNVGSRATGVGGVPAGQEIQERVLPSIMVMNWSPRMSAAAVATDETKSNVPNSRTVRSGPHTEWTRPRVMPALRSIWRIASANSFRRPKRQIVVAVMVGSFQLLKKARRSGLMISG